MEVKYLFVVFQKHELVTVRNWMLNQMGLWSVLAGLCAFSVVALAFSTDTHTLFSFHSNDMQKIIKNLIVLLGLELEYLQSPCGFSCYCCLLSAMGFFSIYVFFNFHYKILQVVKEAGQPQN